MPFLQPSTNSSSLSPPARLLFVATEDWFFASHFLPMVRAGRSLGLDVAVAARFFRHREIIEAAGARAIDLDTERGNLGPWGLWRPLQRLARILRRERPAIIHCVSLRAMLLGGMARRFAHPDGALIQAITGTGFVGARTDRRGRSTRGMLKRFIRGPLELPRTWYLFENADDAQWLSLDPDARNVALVPGAGVDPERFPATPLPDGETLKVAVIARMLWSKGIDLAVEAVGLARAAGADVTLSLYGAPDPANPRAIPEADLLAWDRRDGVSWMGRTEDVARVWREHHVACLPSRGGEGLPRTLLEAASSGRPIVTTNVPGCNFLVRDGREGILVPPEDAKALAVALQHLAANRRLAAAMGAEGAARVRNGFTEADVEARVRALYLQILDAIHNQPLPRGPA